MREYRQETITILLFSALVVPLVLAVMVLPFVRWGFTDDIIFIKFLTRGIMFAPPIHPESGRFVPLAHQEWRLLPGMVSAASYHFVAILQYALFCIATAFLVLRVGRWASEAVNYGSGNTKLPSTVQLCLSVAAIATVPAVLISFGNIVLPERNQLLFFAIFLSSYLCPASALLRHIG